MNIWTYLRAFLAWIWRGVRAWLEVGGRLSQIEQDLQEQVVARKSETEHLQGAIAAAAEAELSSFTQIRDRIEELDKQQREQLSSLDRALQSRVDEWARLLSGQMNQLYAAVARSPVEIRKS